MTTKYVIFASIFFWFVPEMRSSTSHDITGTYNWNGERILLTKDSMFYYIKENLFDKGAYSVSGRHILFVSEKGEPKTVPIEVDTLINNSPFSSISVRIVNKNNEREKTIFKMGPKGSPYGGPFNVEYVGYDTIINGESIDFFLADRDSFLLIYKPIYTEINSIRLELFRNVSEIIAIGYHGPTPYARVHTSEHICSIPTGNLVRITVRLSEDDFNSSVLYGRKFRVKKNCLEVTDMYGTKRKFKRTE